MTIKEWCDRQISVKSWQRPGLSPLNFVIVAAILGSAVLFAIDTEQGLTEAWGAVLPILNLGVLALFAVEFCLRVWSSGEARGISGLANRVRDAGPVWLAVDFLAFAPELALLAVFALTGKPTAEWVVALRLFRLLRVVKLARYVPGARILIETIASVWAELIASVTIAATLIFLSAVLIYFAEGQADPVNFGSVPRALWWSVITLTTVGYGDVLPHTLVGRIAAGAVAILGVGIVALPSGIIAGAFIERLRDARMKKRRADEETVE